LREMTRLGLKPGVPITVEAGTRNTALRVRVGDRPDSMRLSEILAAGIFVTAGPNHRAHSRKRTLSE
jgi:hypothetical protein